MTIAKRVLSMAAALTMMANGSFPLDVRSSLLSYDIGEMMLYQSRLPDDAGDEEPTEGEDDEPTEPEELTTDEECPSLNVVANTGGNWTNELKNWTVETDENAQIYFKTSDKPFEADTDSRVGWKYYWGIKALEPGDCYVRFYAVWADDWNHHATASDLIHYRLDNTPPAYFGLKSDKTTGNLINDRLIKDDLSGIYKVFCTVGETCANYNEAKAKGTELTPEKKNGGVNITVPTVVDGKSIEGQDVYVYAFDKARNMTYAYTKPDDIDVPVMELLDVVNINNGVERSAITHEYGSKDLEKHPVTNYTYVSDKSYLKIKVTDKNWINCGIKVEYGSHPGEFADFWLRDAKDPEGIKPPKDVVYIPVSEIGLSDKKVYSFTLWVTDTEHTITQDSGRKFFYSNSDDKDAKVTVSVPNKHILKKDFDKLGLDKKYEAYLYETGEEGNKLNITLTDDVGIEKYDISIVRDDGEVIYDDDDDLKDGEMLSDKVATSDEDIPAKDKYSSPRKSFSTGEIDLEKDGEYTADIKVSDLEGNIKSYHYTFAVDTTAPVIKNNSYSSATALNFTKYGIFFKDRMELKVIALDDVSGINDGDIKLHITDADGNKKTYNANASKDEKDKGKGIFVFDTVSADTDGDAYITIKDKLGNERKYYFRTVDENGKELTGSRLTTKKNTVRIVVDNKKPQFVIHAKGKNRTVIKDKDGNERLFLGFGDDFAFTYSLSDDKGLDHIKASLNKINDKGKEEPLEGKSAEKYYLEGDDPCVADGMDTPIPIKIPSNLSSGKYSVNTEVTDLAGNVSKKPKEGFEDYPYFYVDKDAPKITGLRYTVEEGALRYTKLGIFGRQTLAISMIVKDNVDGSGVASAELYWNKNRYTATKTDNADELIFKGIKPDGIGVPYVVVKDYLGNENHYYFTINTIKNDDKQIGELIIEKADEADKWISLILEDDAPFVDIFVDAPTDYYIVNGKKWYSEKVHYKIVGYDRGTVRSGLRTVKVQSETTGEDLHTANSYKNFSFEKEPYVKYVAEYGYDIEKEGHYKLKAIVEDNSGNSSNKTEEFFIDMQRPEITAFVIEGNRENEPFDHEDTYGYFFKDDATVRVYVRDPGSSSGIAQIVMYTQEKGKEEYSKIFTATMIERDDDGRQYAEIEIPKGFKGHIAAQVTDNVGHRSDKLAPDGTVIEDGSLHSEHASITIEPRGTEVNGLYNHALTLDVTVRDTFSGISDISWSIEKDNKSGDMKTAPDGSINSSSDVGLQVVSTDANLITEVKFQIVVESDANDNHVNISMTDNAGNGLNAEGVYSIDLTPPVITTTLGNGKSNNQMYYDGDQTVNITILERNFDPNDAKVYVNGELTGVSWGTNGGEGNNTAHTASVSIGKDGDYSVNVDYTDMAGNGGTFDPGQHFIVDKTVPVITTNFADFKTGTPDDVSGSTELYLNNEGSKTAAFEVTVTEKNFEESDLNLKVSGRAAGSPHKDGSADDWFTVSPELIWKHDTAKDTHKLTFRLEEDGVYKIEINPVDRAGNAGTMEEGSEPKTDIFEVDTTAPALNARNEGDYAKLTDDRLNALAVYDLDRLQDEAPFVEFADTNIYRLEYELTTFRPMYTDGREIGEITPDSAKSKTNDAEYEKDKCLTINKVEKAEEQDTIRYTLPEFEMDGVYSVKLYAVDLAGNKSELSDNTYVRILNTPLLAYIENSSSVSNTGWYSFEDEEYGPISKQPGSFEDLDIVMFSKTGTSPKILLVNKDTEEEMDTGVTSESVDISENEMYMIQACRYSLPGEYFARNFTEDVDTKLYLRAENEGEYIDLGEMYIDNTKPECAVPDYLKNWGWLRGSGDKTITFTGISEVLDETDTVVYINGKEISADGKSVEIDGKRVNVAYNVKNDELNVTLPTGTYSIGAKLVDKAGNMRIITEVDHFEVGNTRIWLIISAIATVLTVVLIIAAVSRSKRHAKGK